MQSLIAEYGSWVLSASTIILTIMGGYKWRYTWAWGLFSLSLWLTWILVKGEYGLLPMNVVLWVAYAYNHYLWTREPKDAGT